MAALLLHAAGGREAPRREAGLLGQHGSPAPVRQQPRRAEQRLGAHHHSGQLVMRSRRLVATLAIAAIASLGTGCANGDGGTAASTRIDLGPAQHFAAFPLYFLGTRYRTYRLTSDG